MNVIVTRQDQDELYHYGVKGMKWGVRNDKVESARASYKTAKNNYKQANKAYSKAYNSAYNYSSMHPISQFVSKKKKAESDRRWKEAYKTAAKAEQSKALYKAEKKAYKAEKIAAKAQASKAKATSQKKASQGSSKAIDTYFEKTAQNTKIRRAGYAASIAGTAMNSIGKQMYNKYCNNSTPGKTMVMNGMGYGGKALQAIGSMTVAGATVKQYADYKKYW